MLVTIFNDAHSDNSQSLKPRIPKQCKTSRVPFFFKQWGGANKKQADRELEGRTWNEMPDVDPVQKNGSLYSQVIIKHPE